MLTLLAFTGAGCLIAGLLIGIVLGAWSENRFRRAVLAAADEPLPAEWAYRDGSGR